MLLILFGWLQEFGVKVPHVFMYFSTRMLLAAITSLVLCIVFGPRFIKKLYELKIGQTIRTEECPLLGELHHKKQDTPTMGGVLILFSIMLSLLLWMDLKHPFTLILAGTTLFLGFIGGMDDYLKLKHRNTKGLSGKKKLIGQLLVSLVVAGYLLYPPIAEGMHQGNWFSPPIVKEQERHTYTMQEYLSGGYSSSVNEENVLSLQEYGSRFYVPFLKGAMIHCCGWAMIVAVLFIIFVITGSSNAVNLTDGLDGLAAGNLIMVSACFAFIAFLSNNIDIAGYLNIVYVEGSGEVGIFLSALAGACLGFLWYNGHPAQVFMGDTGSLALGGALGVSAVLLKKELLLGIVGGIFVVEALSVILQVASYKLRNKKRVFLCAPLHHHFEYKGWPETKVVLRFWIVGFLLAIIGLASLKFQ
jgi:phospho-N-acetylmuramoyl-pentapeptide-transferase